MCFTTLLHIFMFLVHNIYNHHIIIVPDNSTNSGLRRPHSTGHHIHHLQLLIT